MLLCALWPPHVEARAWGVALAVAALMGALAPAARGALAETGFVALAAGAAAFHLMFSVQPLQSSRALALCAAGALAALFCARASRHGDDARRAAWIGLAVAGTLLSIHGLWQSVTGFGLLAETAATLPEAMRARVQSGRAVATLGLPGALAGFLALSLPITVSLVVGARAARRMPETAIALTAALLQGAALIATRSASAMAALALAVSLVTWSRHRTAGGRRLAMAALAAGAVLAAGMVAWRLGSASAAMEGAGPFALRAGNWSAALAMAAERPLFGGGLGTYGILFPSHRTWQMNESRFAHNTWLQIGAEAGVPAALAAALLASWFIARLLRTRPAPGAGPGASFAAAVACIGFLVHNAADFTFYLPSVALPFFCLAGFAAASPGAGPSPGRAPAARLSACAALAMFALWVSSADARRERAGEIALAGPPHDAVESARDAVSLNPIDPESHDLLARLLLERAAASGDAGALSLAEAHAARAVDLDEMTPGHWNLLGRVRLARSDPQGAYIALHRAALLYPIRIQYRQDRDTVAAMLARPAEKAPAAPADSPAAPPVSDPDPAK